MLIIAFIPLVVLLAQPLGYLSFWVPVLLIGIGVGASSVVSQYLHDGVGYVPETRCRIGGGYRWHGRWFRQRPDHQMRRLAVRLFCSKDNFKQATPSCLRFAQPPISWHGVMKLLVPKHQVITTI